MVAIANPTCAIVEFCHFEIKSFRNDGFHVRISVFPSPSRSAKHSEVWAANGLVEVSPLVHTQTSIDSCHLRTQTFPVAVFNVTISSQPSPSMSAAYHWLLSFSVIIVPSGVLSSPTVSCPNCWRLDACHFDEDRVSSMGFHVTISSLPSPSRSATRNWFLPVIRAEL